MLFIQKQIKKTEEFMKKFNKERKKSGRRNEKRIKNCQYK